jgi:hypothetical protein
VNISKTSQRLHILNPETPFFKIKCQKKGLVAPGMSEEIEVPSCLSDVSTPLLSTHPLSCRFNHPLLCLLPFVCSLSLTPFV